MAFFRSLATVAGFLVASFAGLMSAQAQCFDKQVVAAQPVGPNEKSFTFQPPMHLCDGNNTTSGDISNAVVLLILAQDEVMTSNKAAFTQSLYLEVNYNFYSGSGTWGGYQPVIVTIQDANHNDLSPSPIFDENTPRGGCRYGRPIPYKSSEKLDPNFYPNIAFVTFQVPRVSGTQHQC